MGDALHLPGSVVEMIDDAPQKALWEVRKAGLNIMMSLKGDGKPVSFIEDCAVPLQHLAEYTDALTEVFARHGTRGTWYAHASVGTLHVRPILDMRRDGAAKMRAIADEAAALVRKFKGAYSGEHGDGLCRGEWIAWQFGPRINEAFRAIKQQTRSRQADEPGQDHRPAEDGRQGAVPLRARLPDDHADAGLRLVGMERAERSGHRDDDGARAAAATRTGGLAKAVEMCNNNGHCRKFDAGTMCPSYRVTRDEQHLTRGRANTLRLALSGQLGADALTGDAVAQALDLCVGCKGCKRDCPTGVDMARMKLEVLAQYQARHGLTVKDRLLGAPARLRRRWPAACPGCSTCATGCRGCGRAGQRWFGVSARALAAALSARHLLARRRRPCSSPAAPSCWPRPSRWSCSSTPSTATSRARTRWPPCACCRPPAIRCMRRVANAEPRCVVAARCSPPAWPSEAKARARQLLDALAPLAARGIAIVGLEPSCLLTLRDEILAMGLGADADTVAGQALLLEEFLAREARAGRFAPALRPASGPMLVHGHCHQKAFAAIAPVLEVLRLIPGAAADADREFVLRHGRQLRLRGRTPRGLDADGRVEPAAGRARRARRR